MARKMTATERAARDAMKPYVRSGLVSQATVNQTIRQGLGLVEKTVRENYSNAQTLYYAGKIAEAREKWESSTGLVARKMAEGRLMCCEMYAAVYKVVQEERGDASDAIDTLSMEQAADVMGAVRDAAREARAEADVREAAAA